MDNLIELKNISKTYERKRKKPVKALRGISLSFGETGFNFIVGRSGGGKTTLLNILAGTDSPTSGEAVFCGKSLSSFKREDIEGYRNEIVGTVFQDYYLIPYYSVGENVKIALDLKYGKMSEDEKKRKVDEHLRKVGLIDEDGDTLYDRGIAELSGGQKQRVAIARAMIKKPKLLLCDEPTGALDERTGKEIFELLRELSGECLVIVVTHDESFAREYGDRLIRIDAGKVTQDSSTDISEGVITQELGTFPGKIGFAQCMRMGIRVLLHKRVRLAISMVAVVFALLIAGISIMNLTLDENYAYIRQAYDSNGKYILVECVDGFRNENGDEWELLHYPDDETVKKLKEYGAIPVSKNITGKNIPIDEFKELEIKNKYEGEHWAIARTAFDYYKGSIEVDESIGLKPDSRFRNPSICKLPSSPDEIAVSDIKFEMYKLCDFLDGDGIAHSIKTPDDLIGLKVREKLPIAGECEFTVCGVFETPDSTRIRSYPVREETYGCMSALTSGNFLVNYLYVCPNFYDLLGYELNFGRDDDYNLVRRNAAQYYLPLKNGVRSDYVRLKELTFEKDGHRYGYKVSCGFSDRVSVWRVFVEEQGDLFFGVVSAVMSFFAVMMSLNFLLGSINARKKEFGILLSLGASRGTVWLIFFIECMAISLIEFVASYIGMWLICAITNAAFFHTIYFTAGLLPFLLIFAGSIVFTGIAALISLLPLGKVSPKDIVSRAG